MTSLNVGHSINLTIEKPAAGGRMIARLDGQVVLVSGAIPGERVTARIERIGKGVVFAATTDVLDPSPDRRQPFVDGACGGLLYAHIEYARQLEIKASVIADAFGRVGRLPLPAPVPVVGSPEHGYRMRARLHVRDGRVGFFREGTHTLCDARATRQLLPATCDVLDELAARLQAIGTTAVSEIEVSENLDASERAIHLEGDRGLDAPSADPAIARIVERQVVTDRLSILGCVIELERHVLAFFQGNRYLLEALVASVVNHLAPGGTAVDLYAGVGLFAVSAAVCRGAHVTAVEGDQVSAVNLRANARQVRGPGAVRAVHEAVESFGSTTRERPDAVVIDPPRTGMSREALDGAIRLRSQRLVYVSCDVATLARDARRLVDAGYSLTKVDGFDLFPNTPHIETVAVFGR